jgi:hypothetical protein
VSEEHFVHGDDEYTFWGICDCYDYFCGFQSANQLFEWFEGFEYSLEKYGFQVKVFEVDDEDVYSGKYQVVFKKANAELVKSMPFEAALDYLN